MLCSLDRKALSNNKSAQGGLWLRGGLVIVSGLARWLPEEWWLAERPCGVQLSFELKPELSYCPSFVKMASRLPPQHLQLAEGCNGVAWHHPWE
jgi:hypothetical protein